MHTARTALATFVVMVMAVFSAGHAKAQTAAATGSVVDESGQPVAGARITFAKVSYVLPGPNGKPRFGPSSATTVITGSDGSFTNIGSLVAGEYNVCAEGPNTAYLGSCEWGGIVTRTQVGQGQNAVGLSLSLQNGVVLNIHLDDPSGRIKSVPSAGARPAYSNFGIGVISDTGFYKVARLVKVGGGGADFTVTVPKNGRVRLLLDAPFSVTENGVALAMRMPTLPILTTNAPVASVNLAVP